MSENGKRKRDETSQNFQTKKGKKEVEEVSGFRCGVCFESMCWEKTPRMMPCCGHSFCSDCLQKIFLSTAQPTSPTINSNSSQSPGMNCPSCRKKVECQSVECFDKNYLIPETIDSLDSSQVLSLSFSEQPEEETPKCANFESCAQQTFMYCPKCEMFICDSCDPSHTSTLFSRNHKRELRHSRSGFGNDTDSLMAIRKKHCSEHSSEFMSGYCFECSVFVCVHCIYGNHGRHKEKVCPLDESVKKRREEVLKLGEKVKKRMESVEQKQRDNREDIRRLKEELMMKEAERKELKLEMEDLKMRHDTINRLSSTPTDDSILNEEVFFTVVQTAKNLIEEILSEKRVVPMNGVQLVMSCQSTGSPQGICLNSDGNFLIAEWGKRVILRNSEGTLIRRLGPPGVFENLIDVSLGINDQIVVLDHTGCKVGILDKEGHLIRLFGTNGEEDGEFIDPCGITVDKEGRIIVADTENDRIQVFDNDGGFLYSFCSPLGQLRNPRKVIVNEAGNLVISDSENSRIVVTTIEGHYILSFGDLQGFYQLRNPSGVAVDEEGRIVVADWGNARVCVFEKEGDFLYSFSSPDWEPEGVFVDSFGSVVVSDTSSGAIHFWKSK